MALRIPARMLNLSLPRAAYRQARTVAHRQFASSAHNSSKSGDTPWIPHGATGHGESRAPAVNTPTTPPLPPPPAEPTNNEETFADAEGTEVPVEETQDAPKEAAQAEAQTAESTKYDDGAPSQTSEAETDHEQIDEPQRERKKGTVQDDSDTEPRPTELGKARVQAKQGKAPKEAASGGDSF
ncbi:hypothetical protein F5148DRAFT_1162839 [Russula earlei]|uniref:Uncharacterized protein n=1 Tax=Russula earlei TaxID=71964 RepID=A0ACC0UKW6_9AGAM|nr:hypothetical protein F5148DRAFT_1162839 [Russula earlei]